MTSVRGNALVALIVSVIVCGLAACGGGGGGGGGSGGGAPQAGLTYSGNSSAAVINGGNAAQLSTDLLGGGAAATAGPLAGVATAGPKPTPSVSESLGALAHRLQRASRIGMAPSGGSQALAGVVPVDQTQPCDSGGTARVFGTLNDNGTGTLAVTFNSCRTGSDTLNGQASVRIDAFDFANGLPTDATVMYTRISFSGPDVNVDVSGALRVQVSIATNTEIVTENFITLDNATKLMTKTENLVFVNTYTNVLFPSSYSETITGRVFDSIHGYVDVMTTAPLFFNTIDQPFPAAGQLTLSGAANKRLRLTAVSAALLTVALDLDGDNSYENTATLKWTDLATPIAADLADSDGDGMHNSWETVNGLDPRNPSDALADADGDGVNNLAEYQGGSDPRNALSVPVLQSAPPPIPGSPPPSTISTLPHLTLAGASDILFDAVSGKMFAAVRGNPGSVVPIDPATRTAAAPISVGIDPVRLAVSDNGQFLYVALDGEPALQRIAIATGSVDLKFSLGSDPEPSLASSFGPRYVEDMQVLPGNPHALAVSMKYKLVSPRHAGVAVFYDGVMQGAQTSRHTGSNVIEFSSSAATLYGYNNETTEFGFRRMSITAAGVSVIDVWDSFHPGGALIEGFNVDIAYGAGRIFSTSGRVIDPTVPGIVGVLPLPNNFGNLAVVDAGSGRAFYLALDGGPMYSLRAFDVVTRAEVGSLNVGAVGTFAPPRSLIRYGAKGLAFVAGDDIFFAESSVLIP